MRKALLIGLIFLGIGLRFYYFAYPLTGSAEMTVDEAVYGLQAINILNGQRPIFYPAQDYTGSFSAYLSALIFSLGGVSAWGLKLVPGLFSVGTIFLNYFLARRIFGPRSALGALFFTALATPFWNNWASRAGTGYVEETFLGSLVLLLTLKLSAAGNFRSYSFLLLGFFSGLGFWIQPTMVYFILPSLIFLFLNPAPPRRLFGGLSAFGLGFFVGAGPVFYANIFLRPGSTANALFRVPWGVRGATIKLISLGFPVLLGGRTSNSLVDFNVGLARPIYVIFALSFFNLLGQIFSKNGDAFFRKPAFILLLTFLSTVGVFLISSPFNQLSIEPRYVFSLYALLPLILGNFLARFWEKRKLISIFIIILFSANSLLGLVQAGPLTFVDRYRFGPLVESLRAAGIKYAITTPAVGHRLMFFSEGKILAQVRGGGITEARFEKLNREVTKVRDLDPRLVAYVTLVNEPALRSFRDEAFGLLGDRLREETIENHFVVLSFKP